RRVLIYADATSELGMGHLMRALAVGQEAAARGWSVEIAGHISQDARHRAAAVMPNIDVRSIGGKSAAAFIRKAALAEYCVLPVESYDALPQVTEGQTLLSNMQDGAYGVRPADLSIDANLGAEEWFERPGGSTRQLAGVDVAVIRDQVRRQCYVPLESSPR